MERTIAVVNHRNIGEVVALKLTFCYLPISTLLASQWRARSSALNCFNGMIGMNSSNTITGSDEFAFQRRVFNKLCRCESSFRAGVTRCNDLLQKRSNYLDISFHKAISLNHLGRSTTQSNIEGIFFCCHIRVANVSSNRLVLLGQQLPSNILQRLYSKYVCVLPLTNIFLFLLV